MNELGLNAELLLQIKNVLRQFTKVTAAVVFGSRAKGNFSDFSDIDIAVYGDCDALYVEKIICELDDLPTPYTYDVVGYNSIKSVELREHIERVGVTIYERV
jgi:predicted nucleotidyltransferase